MNSSHSIVFIWLLFVQDENKRLCSEYEDISNTALSSPNNTEELVNLKQKVSHIKTVIMIEKEKELNKAAQRLVFLSDYLQVTKNKCSYLPKDDPCLALAPKYIYASSFALTKNISQIF